MAQFDDLRRWAVEQSEAARIAAEHLEPAARIAAEQSEAARIAVEHLVEPAARTGPRGTGLAPGQSSRVCWNCFSASLLAGNRPRAVPSQPDLTDAGVDTPPQDMRAFPCYHDPDA